MKRKISAAFIAVLLIASLMPLAMAGAPQSAVAVASVTGTGQAPIIEYKFELNDDADGPDHLTPGTQVTPVPDGNKQVCVYVVAWDPNGAGDINRVWITVNNPSGQVAYGDTGTVIMPVPNIVELTPAEGAAITQTAFEQNLLTSPEKTQIDDQLLNGERRMWEFCFELTHCDEAGTYTVLAKANDGIGNTGQLENTFEYVSIKEIALDFVTVDYGEVIPGVKQKVSGDLVWYSDMNTPADPTDDTGVGPTIRNRGNDPFKLQISATDMIGTDPANIILGTNLDATVYSTDPALTQEQYLDYTPGVLFDPIIKPCVMEKIDFSLLQAEICMDTYTGTITIEPVSS